MAIQQVSGSSDAVHEYVYYSASVQSETAEAQKIYNRHDHIRNSTPRYMQAVRNNVQVSECNVATRAGRDCHDPAARARNSDYSASHRIIQARYDAYYVYATDAYNSRLKFSNLCRSCSHFQAHLEIYF